MGNYRSSPGSPLGVEIDRILDERHWSVGAFAAAVGISPNRATQFRRGGAVPTEANWRAWRLRPDLEEILPRLQRAATETLAAWAEDARRREPAWRP